MATKNAPWGCIRVRPGTTNRLRKLAKSRDLKNTAVIDLLVRGWDLLTPDQQEKAFSPIVKGAER